MTPRRQVGGPGGRGRRRSRGRPRGTGPRRRSPRSGPSAGRARCRGPAPAPGCAPVRAASGAGSWRPPRSTSVGVEAWRPRRSTAGSRSRRGPCSAVEALLVDDGRDAQARLLDQVALDRVGQPGDLARAQVRRSREAGDLPDAVAERAPAAGRGRARPPSTTSNAQIAPSWASFSSSVIRPRRSATRSSSRTARRIAVGAARGGIVASALSTDAGRQAADELALGEQVEDERRDEGEGRVGEDPRGIRACTASRSSITPSGSVQCVGRRASTSGSRNWFQLPRSRGRRPSRGPAATAAGGPARRSRTSRSRRSARRPRARSGCSGRTAAG